MEQVDIAIAGKYSGHRLIIAGLESRTLDECYYVIDFGGRTVHRRVFGTGEERRMLLRFLSDALPEDCLPYGLSSHSQLLPYYLHPHSLLELPGGELVAAFKQAPYFRTIASDFSRSETVYHSAGSQDAVLSSTHCIIPGEGRFMYSRASGSDKVRRYCGDRTLHDVELWSADGRGEERTRLLTVPGFLNDTLHQVGISPDGGIVVGLDMNLAVEADSELSAEIRASGALAEGALLDRYLRALFDRSRFFVWDRTADRVHVVTPQGHCNAHVIFDTRDPRTFYVSSHNISKLGSNVVCHGPGMLEKYRYDGERVVALGHFTDPAFFRITSHCLFGYPSDPLIAVTVYPNKVFLIDPDSMTLRRAVTLFDAPPRDGGFVCDKSGAEPLFLAPSEDGRFLFLTGSSDLFVLDTERAQVVERVQFAPEGLFLGTAHVMLTAD